MVEFGFVKVDFLHVGGGCPQNMLERSLTFKRIFLNCYMFILSEQFLPKYKRKLNGYPFSSRGLFLTKFSL
jgi:hypothetical protein